MKKKSILLLGLATLAMSFGTLAAVGAANAFSGDAVVVKAEEVKAYELVPEKGSNNTYAGNCDIQINGITWNLTGNSTTIPWRIGGKSLTKVDRSLYSKTALNKNISRIDVSIGDATDITVNSFTVSVFKTAEDAAKNANAVSSLNPAFKANSTIAVSKPEDANWENCFYRFAFNVTVTSKDNEYLQLNDATFYEDSTQPSISIADEADFTLTSGDKKSISIEAKNIPEGGSIAVSVDDKDIATATVNAESTAIEFVAGNKVGKANYKVSILNSSQEEVASCSGSVTVKEKDPEGLSKGTALFGIKIDSANVSFKDSLQNSWTVVTTGTTSFTTDSSQHQQIGSKRNPAKSISFNGILDAKSSIQSFSIKVGGFSNTAGNISIKVDGTEVAIGSLNGENDVVVSIDKAVVGKTITIDFDGIARGVKIYSIEYAITPYNDPAKPEVDAFVAANITPYKGAPAEGDTCKAKAQRALDAYNAMSEEAKKLFDEDSAYAADKAIYDYWLANSGISAKLNLNNAPFSSKTAEWASTGAMAVVSIAAVALSLGGLLFFAKKHN
mgnify:CR=1 FL=1